MEWVRFLPRILAWAGGMVWDGYWATVESRGKSLLYLLRILFRTFVPAELQWMDRIQYLERVPIFLAWLTET